ncbi:hypothetical protein Tco_1492370 [Tanacetum coccineum]
MLIESIEKGPYEFKKEITILGVSGALDQKREQTLADLTPEEKIRYNCDIKATNIILLGLPVDIYTLINHFQTAKEIWDRVKELMEGTELTLQEKSPATGTRGTNTVSDVNANQSRVIRCYNYKGEGYIAKQCTAKKRVKDAEWSKEKMLLAQAQEAGVILHED